MSCWVVFVTMKLLLCSVSLKSRNTMWLIHDMTCHCLACQLKACTNPCAISPYTHSSYKWPLILNLLAGAGTSTQRTLRNTNNLWNTRSRILSVTWWLEIEKPSLQSSHKRQGLPLHALHVSRYWGIIKDIFLNNLFFPATPVMALASLSFKSNREKCSNWNETNRN